MKRIIVILLALILSSMIFIVGNASKPTSPSSHLHQQTPWYFPIVFSNSIVNGGTEIEDGVHGIGGWGFWAGEPLDLDVEFWASSQEGEVTYLRSCTWYYDVGCSVDDVYRLPWEPFVSHKTYTIYIIRDYHPLYVHVQYRDNLGNNSRTYTDDIGINGWPHSTTTASPTSTATPTIIVDPP